MTVLLLIIVLTFLVLVHEWGHFFVAKNSGIDVKEFGLGLPPRAWGKKIGDTVYSLNWIPFGGFVRIAGDDEDSTPGFPIARPGHSFKEKSFFTKISVMVGGVIANAYLAFFLIAAAFWIGLPVSLESFPKVPVRDSWVAIVGTIPDSPAREAGLMLPSRLVAVSVGEKKIAVNRVADVQILIRSGAGNPVTLYIQNKDGLETSYTLMPTLSKDGSPPSIGVELDKVGIPNYGIFGALKQSFTLSGTLIANITTEIVLLISRVFSGAGSLESVSGPVGIAGILADARSEGWGPLFFMVALISMSLAVINFAPFPALDGGRLLFLLIEAIMRKPIKPAISRFVNLAGFALLLLLMFFVTYHDIVSL
ncbi:MAG TPA: site-2 protease family protein [Candidatus Paceibacterota bacterium]